MSDRREVLIHTNDDYLVLYKYGVKNRVVPRNRVCLPGDLFSKKALEEEYTLDISVDEVPKTVDELPL